MIYSDHDLSDLSDVLSIYTSRMRDGLVGCWSSRPWRGDILVPTQRFAYILVWNLMYLCFTNVFVFYDTYCLVLVCMVYTWCS